MPRSYGNLWDKAVSMENIVLAYRKARGRKRRSRDIQKFHNRLYENLTAVQENMLNPKWTPSPYTRFTKLNNGKLRQIEAPLFRDRVVHHAIVRVIEPLFDRGFIYDSYSCRKGKGTHAAANRLEHFIRCAKAKWDDAYALKCDISRFFPSVNHGVLMDIIGRKIRDDRLLDLIARAAFAPGNTTGVGIPIGSLTSQLFGNVYLDALDHFLKDCAGVRYYVRYADDFVILSDCKERLAALRDDIEWILSTHLKMRLNPKTSIFPLSHGVDFCGYRIWATQRLPRKRVVRAAKRRFERISKLYGAGRAGLTEVRAVAASFLGYMQHCSGRRSADSSHKKLLLKRRG